MQFSASSFVDKFSTGAGRILSRAKQAFNRLVSSGSWDLSKEIWQHPWQKEPRRHLLALDWLKENSNELTHRGLLEQGKLYTFRYLAPKTANLPYWDTNPLLICLGHYQAKNGEVVEIGLNLHYLPKDVRIKVVIKIFDLYKTKWRGQVYRNRQQGLSLDWANLALPLIPLGADFGFRSYIPRLRSEAIEFKFEDWPKAIHLPTKGWSRTSQAKVEQEWQTWMRGVGARMTKAKLNMASILQTA